METPKYDLLEFIKNEKKRWNNIEAEKAPMIYTKHSSKTLIDIYSKLYNVSNLNLSKTIETGMDLLFNVFWTLFAFTYNLKLTMFLSERAILLFTEFIVMSRNPLLNRDMNFIPNINDAVMFSYRKTIGPLKLSHFQRSKYSRQKIALYRNITKTIQDLSISYVNCIMPQKSEDSEKLLFLVNGKLLTNLDIQKKIEEHCLLIYPLYGVIPIISDDQHLTFSLFHKNFYNKECSLLDYTNSSYIIKSYMGLLEQVAKKQIDTLEMIEILKYTC